MTPFGKQNAYFGGKMCNLAQNDSSLNTLQALALANISENIFFSDLCMSQLSLTILSEAWSTLNMESTKSMQTFTSFLKLFSKKEFHFTKGTTIIVCHV